MGVGGDRTLGLFSIGSPGISEFPSHRHLVFRIHVRSLLDNRSHHPNLMNTFSSPSLNRLVLFRYTHFFPLILYLTVQPMFSEVVSIVAPRIRSCKSPNPSNIIQSLQSPLGSYYTRLHSGLEKQSRRLRSSSFVTSEGVTSPFPFGDVAGSTI